MRNKLMLLLSALMVATLVLAACGGGAATPAPAAPAAEATEATAEATEAAAEATEEATEEAAAEATEEATEEAAAEATADASAAVTDTAAAGAAAPAAGGPALTIWADEIRAPVLETIAQGFTEEYGVQVNVVQKGFGDLRNDFKVAAPTGEGPDILLGAHDWIGEFIASGLLAEVSLGDKTASFAPAAVQGFTYTDGKLYGLPQAVENVAFYYNTDLVPTAPTTWEEVQTLSQEIKDAGNKYGFLIQSTDPYHFYPIQTSFGGYVFGKNEDGSYNAEDIGMNSEGSVAAFEWLNGMYEAGLLDRGSNIDGGLLLSAFQNGDAAMLISGPWALSGFREAGVPYAVAPIPAGTEPGGPFAGVQGFMINAFSKNQLLAQTFLQEFVATDETMQAFFDQDPRVSAWTPVADKIEDPDLQAFAAAGATADPMPNIPEMNSVWQAWSDAMTLISNGDLEPQAALDQAQEQIQTAIAGQ
jgi:maltose/maltodextrin transport system substrate-binding protein/arabinogalactan oligomer/maltooligosaccharide transport system substrate-binding protein